MAEWSGPAKAAHKYLAEFLAQNPPALEHLICIDLDRQPEVYNLPELSGKIHGYGEAAVINDGFIVFATILGKEKSQISERCEELLRKFNDCQNTAHFRGE